MPFIKEVLAIFSKLYVPFPFLIGSLPLVEHSRALRMKSKKLIIVFLFACWSVFLFSHRLSYDAF